MSVNEARNLLENFYKIQAKNPNTTCLSIKAKTLEELLHRIWFLEGQLQAYKELLLGD